MIRLGLTGSIGMGKSTIAGMFRDEGIPVWDADEAVHRLYATSPVVKQRLAEAFGDVLSDGQVDRVKLSAALKRVDHGFDKLNAIVHPLVVDDRRTFIEAEARRHAGLVVVDIPLLYETAADSHLDYVLVVSAPAEVQKARVMARPGMSEDKFAAILARQIPDAEKRRRAHFVIDTGQSLETCRAEVRKLVNRFTDGGRA